MWCNMNVFAYFSTACFQLGLRLWPYGFCFYWMKISSFSSTTVSLAQPITTDISMGPLSMFFKSVPNFLVSQSLCHVASRGIQILIQTPYFSFLQMLEMSKCLITATHPRCDLSLVHWPVHSVNLLSTPWSPIHSTQLLFWSLVKKWVRPYSGII